MEFLNVRISSGVDGGVSQILTQSYEERKWLLMLGRLLVGLFFIEPSLNYEIDEDYVCFSFRKPGHLVCRPITLRITLHRSRTRAKHPLY
jgi:hypothetical protein